MKILSPDIATPTYVIDGKMVSSNASLIEGVTSRNSSKLIYALKAMNFYDLCFEIKPHVSGFGASSLFEARFAKEILGQKGSIHFTAPGIRTDEIEELCELCDYLSFNSLGQWQRFKGFAVGRTSPGLRINPQLSFVEDERYNPSAKHSKLGVPLDQLVCALEENPERLKGIEGLHFHNNSEANEFSPLLETVRHLEQHIGPLLQQVRWINLGGGYYFSEDMDFGPFEAATKLLKSRYDLEIIIEPGSAIVQEAGYLVSSVIDLFESDGKTVAILDTTVNHLPEVLEFQYNPDVMNASESGEFEYVLAGASCLAGDQFGTYRFDTCLNIGSRIVFTGVGSYSLVKAHMFNGINLPNVYYVPEGEEPVLVNEFGYQDFIRKCGAVNYENQRKRA